MASRVGALGPSTSAYEEERPAQVAPLCRPLPLGSVALLLLNDHVLKGANVLPGWLTGKLSDVAGLVFFPLLLLALVEEAAWLGGVRLPLSKKTLTWLCSVITALVFGLLKTHSGFHALVSTLWGPSVLDPTDLLALPAAFLGLTQLGPLAAPPRLRAAAPTMVLLAAGASLASMPPRYPRNYPTWTVSAEGTRTLRCANLDAWVSKSGKEGFGLTLRMQNLTEEPCQVTFEGATFMAEGVQIEGVLPAPITLSPFHLEPTYVPFAFNNEKLWNKGIQKGSLRLELQVDGQSASWVMPLVERFDSFHKVIDHDPAR